MNYLFKICLVGDSGTGKTTFIETLVKNFYYESKEKTIGIDFFTHMIDDVKFQIWDTSGNIMFIGIVRSYFHDASGILLFFSNKKSFNNIDNWIQEIKKINQNCKIILIQSQSDSDLDYIDEDEISKTCSIHHIDKFIKINSKYMKNTNSILPEMMKLLVNKKSVEFNNTTDYIKIGNDENKDDYLRREKSFCDKCIIS
jgi:small GTP-binding protein